MDLLDIVTYDWKESLDTAIIYGTFFGVFWQVWRIGRDNQKIAIIAVNADTNEERKLVTLPRKQVTRGEILGTLGLETGGKRYETHLFFWDEKFKKEIRVPLPDASFRLLRPSHEAAS